MFGNTTMPEAIRQISRNEINRAGLLIRDSQSRSRELDSAFDTVGEWRSSHSKALRETYELLEQRAKCLDAMAILSLRLKRIPAIRTKLCRPENRNMKLSTMQDIAGCRAVLNGVEDVDRLAALYGGSKRDYIRHPKSDGYRSIHIVERHHGYQVEIQMRSGLQHAWAAAVEAVDFVLGQRLKTGGGAQEWKWFFKLAASAIALSEGLPLVRDTPTERRSLAFELRKASDEVHALDLLRRVHLMQYSAKNVYEKKKGAAYLVTLDMRDENKMQTFVRVYQRDEIANANKDYINFEKEFSLVGRQHALLLSVDQVSDLEPAYPAYFMQTTMFRWVLEQFMNTQDVKVVKLDLK